MKIPFGIAQIGKAFRNEIIVDKSSDLIYKEPLFNFDNKGLPYSYTDLYGKVSLHGNNGSKFNLFGFNFQQEQFQ